MKLEPSFGGFDKKKTGPFFRRFCSILLDTKVKKSVKNDLPPTARIKILTLTEKVQKVIVAGVIGPMLYMVRNRVGT